MGRKLSAIIGGFSRRFRLTALLTYCPPEIATVSKEKPPYSKLAEHVRYGKEYT